MSRLYWYCVYCGFSPQLRSLRILLNNFKKSCLGIKPGFKRTYQRNKFQFWMDAKVVQKCGQSVYGELLPRRFAIFANLHRSGHGQWHVQQYNSGHCALIRFYLLLWTNCRSFGWILLFTKPAGTFTFQCSILHHFVCFVCQTVALPTCQAYNFKFRK